MAEAFDPYRQWLGVRDPQRPPNLYRLLGVEPFEADSVVLAAAADRQMAQVRPFQAGPYAIEAQRVLNELAAARLCLLQPQRKADYDAWLRTELAAGGPDYRGLAYADPVGPITPTASRQGPSAEETSSLAKIVIGTLSGLVLLLLALIAWVANRSQPVPARPTAAVAVSAPAERPSPAKPAEAKPKPKPAPARPTAEPVVQREEPLPDDNPPAAPEPPAEKAAPEPGAKIPPGASPLRAARIAIQARDLATAATQLDLAQQTATAEQRAEIDRLREALGPLGAFWQTVRSAMADLRPEETLEVAGRKVIVRSASADALVLQNGKDELRYALETLPASLALVVAERKLADLPSSLVLKAAFAAFDPKADKRLARQWCEQAARDGLPVAALLAELGPARDVAAAGKDDAKKPAADKDSRQSIPDPADQAAALAEVRKIHRDDFDAAQDLAKKRALAQTLLKEAIDTSDEPTIRYVLLGQARDLAVTAGDPELLRKVIEETAKHYEVDALGQLIGLLGDVAESRIGSGGKKELARGALDLAEERLAQDDYESAFKLARAAQAMSLGRDSAMSKRAADLLKTLPRLKQEFDRFQQAAQVLAGDPDNPAANLVHGQYYCFTKATKASWSTGLAMLAKGSDAKLKALALSELALARSKPEAGAAFDLAEQWYDALRTADEANRPSYRRRAAHWYQQSLPALQGFKQKKAKLRLDELKSAD